MRVFCVRLVRGIKVPRKREIHKISGEFSFVDCELGWARNTHCGDTAGADTTFLFFTAEGSPMDLAATSSPDLASSPKDSSRFVSERR